MSNSTQTWPAPRAVHPPVRRVGVHEAALHEAELQVLFAVTLALSVAAESAPAPVAGRLLSAVDDINGAIGKVRGALKQAA